MQVIQSIKTFLKAHKKIVVAIILFVIVDIFFGIRFVNNILSIGTAKESGYYYIDMSGRMVNSIAYMDPGTPFNEDGVAYAKGGKIKRIATNTYIVTPCNVDLTGEVAPSSAEN